MQDFGIKFSLTWVLFQQMNPSKLFNQGMILGTSYRDSRGALVATDKVEKRDGSYYNVETGEELEQAPAKMSKSLKMWLIPMMSLNVTEPILYVFMKCSWDILDASIPWSEEGLEGA